MAAILVPLLAVGLIGAVSATVAVAQSGANKPDAPKSQTATAPTTAQRKSAIDEAVRRGLAERTGSGCLNFVVPAGGDGKLCSGRP